MRKAGILESCAAVAPTPVSSSTQGFLPDRVVAAKDQQGLAHH